MGVEWKVRGGRRHMCSGARECQYSQSHDLIWLSSHHSFESGHPKELPGSADLPCWDAPPQSWPWGTLAWCELLPFRWACKLCISYFFRAVCTQHHGPTHQIFPKTCTAPSSHWNWMLVTLWRTCIISPLRWWVRLDLRTMRSYFGSGWGADCIWPRDASDGNLERDWLAPEEDLKIPAFLRVITSSVVYSSKSLVMPRKSVSFLLKGLMVMKGASFPVLGSQYGAAWLHGTTISGKRSLGNCMPLGMRRHPLRVVIMYSCSVQSQCE